MMSDVRKPFDKELHAAHDPKSRELVKVFFAERGITLKDNPNKYDIDLLTEDSLMRIEVEHRTNWVGKEFPYEGINVPKRKDKFFLEGNTHYIILSNDFKYLGFIGAKRIQNYMKSEYLKISPNRFVKQGEKFYEVPRSEFEFYPIT
jgi:hypothetical protein